MTELIALWLPVLLSAVFIFVASSVIHMVMPWHKGDFAALPNEDAARAAIGPLAIPPGDYLVPKPARANDMSSPEYRAKHAQGPVFLMTVMPNGIAPMGPIFVQWMIYLLIIAGIAACLTASVLPPGADRASVWHFSGVTTFVCYAMALPQASIWYHKKWSTTLKGFLDSAIYGVITAVTFGWLWPQN